MAGPSGTRPRVLLLVTGGIAAYKSCYLARLLVQAGFSVRCAMTEAGARFVSPMTFEVLTGAPVATDLWGEGATEALDHIQYARWADIAVVAPATANTMAKAAAGLADNMVSTLLLAFPGPVVMAPAMNDNMWRHPATRAAQQVLAGRGVEFVGPGEGFLACGTTDEGRMAEPEQILVAVRDLATRLPARAVEDEELYEHVEPAGVTSWAGCRVVVTAGPTCEPIDPVRFVANRSTGAMGYALAAAASHAGASVKLISGPVALPPPRGLDCLVSVQTGREMADAVDAALAQGADWLIMCAAVADFAPAEIAPGKLKKDVLGDTWMLRMVRNPDILGEVVPAHRASGVKVVGFALETEDVVNRALGKLRAKGLDFIVANNPAAAGSGFGHVDHELILLGPGGELWRSGSRRKDQLAPLLLQRLMLAVAGGTPSPVSGR
jgi:phosphopantothenoylcysteine decarboxylase/phosphopantothenate--cysteine ligase